jgi:hypothetical protein
MDFKIIFPAGYNLIDELNDNCDINIIFENGDVYFATLFTPLNIQYLLNKDGEPCFWATDMLIIKDLNKQTIREAIAQTIKDSYIEMAFSRIGQIEKQFPNMSFDEIPDVANGLDLSED